MLVTSAHLPSLADLAIADPPSAMAKYVEKHKADKGFPLTEQKMASLGGKIQPHVVNKIKNRAAVHISLKSLVK